MMMISEYRRFFHEEEYEMKYRHEWKHEISHIDMLILRQRLSAVMKRDGHATGGRYMIRSLYFDNM